MVFRGAWNTVTVYNAGDVVTLDVQFSQTPPTILWLGGTWICIQSGANQNTGPPNSAYWQFVAPNKTEVNTLNGATGAVTIQNLDGTVQVSTVPGVAGTVTLSAPQSVQGLTFLPGGPPTPYTGVTTLTSLDGSVVYTGAGGASGSLNLQARQLVAQKVLDAGFYEAYPLSCPTVAPPAAIAFGFSTGLYQRFLGNWTPLGGPPGLVSAVALTNGATYMVTGLLAVNVAVLPALSFLNIALNISGRVPPTPSQTILLPGSPSVYQVYNADTASLGQKYQAVSVIFTCPPDAAAGTKLGLNVYCDNASAVVAVQWVDSFSCVQLNSPGLA